MEEEAVFLNEAGETKRTRQNQGFDSENPETFLVKVEASEKKRTNELQIPIVFGNISFLLGTEITLSSF